MNANFGTCLAMVLQSEGGFVDDPNDPGGATNLGVTINTLSAWLGHPATIADVQALTPDTVGPIYQADYWNITGCQDWPSGVDLMVFDQAVNQGPGRAIRTLQTAVSSPADGLIGPATIAAVGLSDAQQTISRIAALREDEYRALPMFPRYGKGWLARVERTKAKALEMAA